jgi:hypothetical protein
MRSQTQTRNATLASTPARTPHATLCLVAAPVKMSGLTPVPVLVLVAAGAKLVTATAAVVADADASPSEPWLFPPNPPDGGLFPEPEPLPEPDPVVGAAVGIGTRPISGAGPPLPPAGDVGCTVTNVTCGTVTAVVYVLPLAVCVNVTVVTGMATGGVGAGGAIPLLEPGTSGLGPRPAPFVIVAVAVTVPVAVTVLTSVSVAGGTGTNVIVLGIPVQMPGFWGTKSAHMPAR